MSARQRRSERISVPPVRFRFSQFARAPAPPVAAHASVADAPAAEAPVPASGTTPTAALAIEVRDDNPLDRLKEYLSRTGGFAVVDDYHSSDGEASFEDK